MSGDLVYIGICPTSEAARYEDKQFAYESNGVNYYHCFTLKNSLPDTFGNELEKNKVRKLGEVFSEPIDDSIYKLKFTKKRTW